MALKKYKLGELIERSTVNNKDLRYGADLIVGVNNDGVFTKPKGNTIEVDLKPYKLVNNGAFVYNPTRIDLGSLAYRTEGFCIVSHLYIIFYLNEKGKKLINPYYLYIYFHRDEFRREVSFRNFGSQRPEFSFTDMADLYITLPPIDVQRKYVDVYLAMQNNLAAYQSKVDRLKTVCDGYMDRLKKTATYVRIEDILRPVDKRNVGMKYTEVQGININKVFFPTVANIDVSSIRNYKIVEHNQFAFSGMQTGRDQCIRIALNEKNKPIIVSPAYTVLALKNDDALSQYILLWFSRQETDRYGWFASDGSIRSNLDIERFFGMRIPLPNIEIQMNLVKLFKCYLERQRIAEELKAQINRLCPVLIKGSLDT